eukprot:m.873869 g.873869  ORF g.873869 m.873869 type:complete len:393 (-) comp59792_c0_seq2:68-1246(-)
MFRDSGGLEDVNQGLHDFGSTKVCLQSICICRGLCQRRLAVLLRGRPQLLKVVSETDNVEETALRQRAQEQQQRLLRLLVLGARHGTRAVNQEDNFDTLVVELDARRQSDERGHGAVRCQLDTDFGLVWIQRADQEDEVLVKLRDSGGQVNNAALVPVFQDGHNLVTGAGDGRDRVSHVAACADLQPIQHARHRACWNGVCFCAGGVARGNKGRQEVAHSIALNLQVRNRGDGNGRCLAGLQVANTQLEDICALLLEQLCAVAAGQRAVIGLPCSLLLPHNALRHNPVNVCVEGADRCALVDRKHIHSLDIDALVVVELLTDRCACAKVHDLRFNENSLERKRRDQSLVHADQPEDVVCWQQHSLRENRSSQSVRANSADTAIRRHTREKMR